MNRAGKLFAFLSYPLVVVGSLYVLLFRRADAFAVYHAKQSLGMVLAAIASVLIWIVGAWILAWVPLAGPLVAATLFSLVIATYVLLIVCWIMGMINALRGKAKPVPILGNWTRRILK